MSDRAERRRDPRKLAEQAAARAHPERDVRTVDYALAVESQFLAHELLMALDRVAALEEELRLRESSQIPVIPAAAQARLEASEDRVAALEVELARTKAWDHRVSEETVRAVNAADTAESRLAANWEAADQLAEAGERLMGCIVEAPNGELELIVDSNAEVEAFRKALSVYAALRGQE